MTRVHPGLDPEYVDQQLDKIEDLREERAILYGVLNDTQDEIDELTARIIRLQKSRGAECRRKRQPRAKEKCQVCGRYRRKYERGYWYGAMRFYHPGRCHNTYLAQIGRPINANEKDN